MVDPYSISILHGSLQLWGEQQLELVDSEDAGESSSRYTQGQLASIQLVHDYIVSGDPEGLEPTVSMEQLEVWLIEKIDDVQGDYDPGNMDSDDYSFHQGRHEALEIVLNAVQASEPII